MAATTIAHDENYDKDFDMDEEQRQLVTSFRSLHGTYDYFPDKSRFMLILGQFGFKVD